MMKIYSIRDWAENFETHETRKFVWLKWVPFPNKHDGLTFRKIGTEKNAAELFAAWVLIVQIASKSERGQRGRLCRNGTAMTARDMALVTGFPEKIFATALNYFTQPSIGWMIAEEYQTELPLSPGVSGDSPATSGESPGNLPDEKKRKYLKVPEMKVPEKKEGEEAEASVPALLNVPEFIGPWQQWQRIRRLGKKPKSDWPAYFAKQLTWLESFGVTTAIEIVSASARNEWQGLFEPKGGAGKSSGRRMSYA